MRSVDELTAALDRKPRFPLGTWPTPLEEAPQLSSRLGVRVLVKRDDLTGLALGGNKVRKLEFLIGDALAQGADCVITTGGSQSNHARLTAAACRRARLDCYLVLDRGVHPEMQGNLLLDHLFGARVKLIESMDPAAAIAEMESLRARLQTEGRRPYLIPRGGSIPQGAMGYAACAAELVRQLDTAATRPDRLYVGTGSTGTHSGLLAGLTAVGSTLHVQGISVSRSSSQQRPKVQDLATGTLQHLGFSLRVDRSAIRVDDTYSGPGYGIPTEATLEAIGIAAADEALILDPVYTGKVMAGLIGHARDGVLRADDTVVFLHTGGAPALFAYHHETSGALAAPLRA